MDLSKKKKVEEQEVEVLLDNKEIEETKKNEEPETELEVRRPYIWANTVDDGDDELSTLSGDLSDMSIYAAGERLLKSHIFSALGCALFESESMIVWIDWPLTLIKKWAEKRRTSRVYWGSTIKDRDYYYWYYEGDMFGLSPAFQCLKFKKDLYLRKYGLQLKKGRFGFTEDLWPEKIRYLELNIRKVYEEPYKTDLKEWLAMEEDKPTEEQKQETIETDFKLRMEERMKDD